MSENEQGKCPKEGIVNTPTYCRECGINHGSDVTCQEIENRFDGYPKDCIIDDLLEAERQLARLAAEIEALQARVEQLEDEWESEHLPYIAELECSANALQPQLAQAREALAQTIDYVWGDEGSHPNRTYEMEDKARAVLSATPTDWLARHDAEVVKSFYDRVCARAEEKMLATGKLEGAHYAAMQELLAAMDETL